MKAWAKDSRAKDKRIITGRHLQQARQELFDSDPLCAICKAHGRLTLAVERDHVIPLCEDGPDEAENTQGLCLDCHKAKTQAESSRARGIKDDPVMRSGSDGSGMPKDAAHHWNK
jgi:5-methylcytosine-specific restriction protein A